jgi:hypothetical protein
MGGTVFFRSGQPFSVFDSSGGAPGNYLNNATSAVVLADYISGPRTCTGARPNCLDVTGSGFVAAGNQTDFGNLPRNSFRGPHYFNADFSLQKDIHLTERFVFTLGANAFNVLNHPNFANPDADIQNTGAGNTFGQSQSTVTPPNSPYGNFQGAAVSGRVLQLDLKFKF